VIVGMRTFRFLFYLLSSGFCTDMPEDDLSIGGNMYHTCKRNQLNKNKPVLC